MSYVNPIIQSISQQCDLINNQFFNSNLTEELNFCLPINNYQFEFKNSKIDKFNHCIVANIDILKGYNELSSEELEDTAKYLMEIFNELSGYKPFNYIFKTKDEFEYLYKFHPTNLNPEYYTINVVYPNGVKDETIYKGINNKIVGIYKKVKDYFNKLNFPLVKRVSPTLLSNQLVSVQPLPLPTGKLFYFNPVVTASTYPISSYPIQITGNTQSYVYNGII